LRRQIPRLRRKRRIHGSRAYYPQRLPVHDDLQAARPRRRVRVLTMFGRNLSAVIDRSAQADSGRSLAHTHSTVIHMFRIFALLVVAFGLAFGAAAPAMAQSVRVTVNGEGITDTQIEQRLKLFQLEGRSGRDAATNELIDEALM